MKVSLAWLRELVDAPFDADELAQRMTLAGFEIVGREKFAAMSGVIVARVVAKRPHPDAAKLTLVDVDDGSGKPTQVVCGAPNVPDAGGLVVWARPGATLPNGLT
ncbi:MAG: phenylalanine--tRNA ligase subunit beta, partial [Polyangia bacterium]